MAWFNLFKKHTQKLRVPEIFFIGEQTGAVETEAKQFITGILEQYSSVKAAYLCQLTYKKDSTIHIALCLRSDVEEKMIIQQVSEIFPQMFNSEQHLDIIFIGDSQQGQLSKVCKPFYLRK